MRMRKEEKKAEWYIEIYEPMFACFIRIYTDKNEYENLIRKNNWDENYWINKRSDGCTCPKWVFDKSKYCFVSRISDLNKKHIVMHEMFHLVCAINREYWIEEESGAYLISYIWRIIYNEDYVRED